MKTAVTFALLLLCSVGAGRARLGETEAECAARYGAPVKDIAYPKLPAAIAHLYQAGDFRVEAYFLNGHVESLFIVKERGGPFTEKEAVVLLEANAGGFGWQKTSGVFELSLKLITWSRTDGTTAGFTTGENLSLNTRTWQAAKAAAETGLGRF